MKYENMVSLLLCFSVKEIPSGLINCTEIVSKNNSFYTFLVQQAKTCGIEKEFFSSVSSRVAFSKQGSINYRKYATKIFNQVKEKSQNQYFF